ncbi:hypothetical protein M231_04140 [Tremella mesenterica]|uniref:GH26 domain-containing protein n=1 Tax=Tremella mesenterica TaxID=5217 RepID=A0A4Q1BLI9_TREME|nr:hypothetical protein M231_04140 [Tremella mesenterica]
MRWRMILISLFQLLLTVQIEAKTKRTKQCPVQNPNSTSPSSSLPSLDGYLSLNGVAFGFLPDEGVDGGSGEDINQLNQWTQGKKAYTFGWYAQVQAGDTEWKGSQLTETIQQLKDSGAAVFEAAVMPEGGFDGSVAPAVCGVLKTIKQKTGVAEVRLRYGHEVGYDSQGAGWTYTGTPEEYKTAWKSMAEECQPDIKMFYSPNIANIQAYKDWIPTDPKTVDYIGVDYYPSDSGSLTSDDYAGKMQEFHDDFTGINDPSWSHVKFALGETAYTGTLDEKLQWVKAVCGSKDKLVNLVSMSWFNYAPSDSLTYDFPWCKRYSGWILLILLVKGSDMRIVSSSSDGSRLAQTCDGSTNGNSRRSRSTRVRPKQEEVDESELYDWLPFEAESPRRKNRWLREGL